MFTLFLFLLSLPLFAYSNGDSLFFPDDKVEDFDKSIRLFYILGGIAIVLFTILFIATLMCFCCPCQKKRRSAPLTSMAAAAQSSSSAPDSGNPASSGLIALASVTGGIEAALSPVVATATRKESLVPGESSGSRRPSSTVMLAGTGSTTCPVGISTPTPLIAPSYQRLSQDEVNLIQLEQRRKSSVGMAPGTSITTQSGAGGETIIQL